MRFFDQVAVYLVLTGKGSIHMDTPPLAPPWLPYPKGPMDVNTFLTVNIDPITCLYCSFIQYSETIINDLFVSLYKIKNCLIGSVFGL